jgi:hypothetical protein
VSALVRHTFSHRIATPLNSPGAVIAIDHFIGGRPLDQSIQMFPDIMKRAFKQRFSKRIPFVTQSLQFLASFCTDGQYSSDNIEAVFKEIIGMESILDCSHATMTGTKVGLPVATVSRHPLYRIFTNYNGVGEKDASRGV